MQSTDLAGWPTPAVNRIRRRATLALVLFTTVFGAQLLVGAPPFQRVFHGAGLHEAKEAVLRVLDQRERLAALGR
jgi:hypothetical protein